MSGFTPVGDQCLRIALLSFAHVHAAGYASALRDWPGVELICADPDAAGAPPGEIRGAEMAGQLGVDYVSTYAEALAAEPHAVVVCAENAKHREVVELAAAAGAHILCEKPLATTVADGEAMIAACKSAGVMLMVAYPVRFAPVFSSLRGLVGSGRLGTLLGGTGTNNGQIPAGDRQWFTDPDLSGGGAMVDHTVHVADLLDALGLRAEQVHAVSNTILHSDKPAVRAETAGLVTVTYAGGARVTIDCSWSQPDSAPTWGGLTLELVGTGGLARIDPFAMHVGGSSNLTGKGMWLGFGPDLDAAMIEHFIANIRRGSQAQPDGEAGLRTLRIVAAAQKSAATGRVVAIAET